MQTDATAEKPGLTIGDLRRWSALLTTGWARTSGSPDESEVLARLVNTPPHSKFYSEPDEADLLTEQLLWNQWIGNRSTRRATARTRPAPLVRLLTGRLPSRFVRGPRRTDPPFS